MNVVPIYRLASTHPQSAVCASCEVRGTALFGVLDDAGLDRIHTHIASLDVAPDDLLYRRGESAGAIYTIRAGVVRFERFNERGDRRIVRLAGKGDLIGQEALLQRPHSDDAIACTPVQLCRIPIALVNDLEEGQKPLQRELMLRWQMALDDAEAWVAELASGSARQRVLRLLERLDSHADAAGHIWLPRREDIGAMLDMTFETASRQISQLRREGVLSSGAGRATTIDRKALMAALAAQD
jgi:CRP/FNR family transcriptional regulator, anaerobic regulatory protein